MNAAARDRVLFGCALALGAFGWWGVALVSGRREAWDAPEYFGWVLPVTALGLLLLGYLGSRAAWRWPLLVFGAQLASMIARNRELGSLLALGAVLFLVLAAFGLLPTYLGVALRRARQRRKAARFAAALRRAELGIPLDDSS